MVLIKIKKNMGNNEIAILVDQIKLDKELMILDINFIAFKELIKIINENTFNAETINMNIYLSLIHISEPTRPY